MWKQAVKGDPMQPHRKVRLLQIRGCQTPLSAMSCSIIQGQQGTGTGRHGAALSACETSHSELCYGGVPPCGPLSSSRQAYPCQCPSTFVCRIQVSAQRCAPPSSEMLANAVRYAPPT